MMMAKKTKAMGMRMKKTTKSLKSEGTPEEPLGRADHAEAEDEALDNGDDSD
jgi:hypothetical protein